jgi:hypothetical protein
VAPIPFHLAQLTSLLNYGVAAAVAVHSQLAVVAVVVAAHTSRNHTLA